jgi:hypothetical protein
LAIGWTLGRLVVADLTDRLFAPALARSTALGREIARARIGVEDVGLWLQVLGTLVIALGLLWCVVDGLLPMALGAWKFYRNHSVSEK